MINVKSIVKIILKVIFSKTGIPIKIGTNYMLWFHPLYFRWFTSSYETYHLDQLKNICDRPGIAIDIGAHFGLYSLILAKYNKMDVIAFEPTPYSAGIFKANIHFNNLQSKITLWEAAVGEKLGKALFLIQETDGAVSNSLVDYWHSDEKKNKVEVDVVNIDTVVDETVAFMKIDAEGNELDVLKGAEKVIASSRPWILLALHPSAVRTKGDTLEMIWDHFSSLNYTALLGTKKLNKKEFIEKSELFDVMLDPGNID